MDSWWVGLDRLRAEGAIAIRALRRAPAFAFAAVASLAIGVGANVATFSVLDRVLFQSPPGVRDPSSVKRLYIEQPGAGRLPYAPEFSYPALRELSEASGELARIEGYESRQDRTVEGVAGRVTVAYVSGGYFDLLGVRPAAGRFFVSEEVQPLERGPRVAVISYRLWQMLSRSPSIGPGIHSVRIDSVPHEVVGVAEEGFDGVDLGLVGAWIPLGTRPPFEEPLPLLDRSTHSIQLLARLAPGANHQQLEARLTAVYALNNRSDPWFESFGRIVTAPLLKVRGPYLFGLYDQQNMLLAKALAAVGLALLMVTITNVASLFLLRAIRRRHANAVRTALGATAAHLRSHVLIEAALVLAVAAALSVLLGWWVGALLRKSLVFNPHWSATPLPERAVILAVALATMGVLAAAMLPTTGAARVRALDALREGVHGGDYLGPRFRALVLTIQTALGLALLVCGGLFMESLWRLARIDPGFDAARLITVDASGRRMSPGSAAEAIAAISRIPGVARVANAASDLASAAPIVAHPLGVPPRAVTGPAQVNFVDTAYLATAGIALLSGRGIAATDVRGAERVAVISESVADEFWPGMEPLGKCLALGGGHTCVRVVGVVGDVQWNARAGVVGRYYLPLAQSPWTDGHHFVIRTNQKVEGETLASVQSVMADWASSESTRPRVQRVSDRLEALTRPWRTAAIIFILYGALTLVSTATGIYGSIHYDVSQRARELAIRLALGAQPRQIVEVVIASAGRSLACGLAIGVLLVLLVGGAIEPLLYATSRFSPVVLAASIAALVVTAILAAGVPVLKLTRIDAGMALRSS
jgi:predicted permease